MSPRRAWRSAVLLLCAGAAGAAPPAPPAGGGGGGGAPQEPPSPPASAPGQDPQAEQAARQARVEEQLLLVLRERLYFAEAVEGRLKDHTSLAAETREAARRAGLPPDAAAAEVRRLDGAAARSSLAARVPADDDDSIRLLVRADLIRDAAPLPGEKARGREAQAATLAAARKLLRTHMSITGGDAIYGKVDTELARKVCSVVASRAPRPERRPWCELAVWTLLAGGQAERAAEMASACERWIRDADAARARPPGDAKRPEAPAPAASASEDLAAAEALADHASGRSADAVAAAARLRALGGSNSQADPLRLQERVERRLGHG